MIKIEPIKKTKGIVCLYPDEEFNLFKFRKNTTGRTDRYNITLTKKELIELRKEINKILEWINEQQNLWT